MDLSALAEPELVVLYRVSQRRTLHLLDAGLSAHLTTFADRSSLRSLAGHRPRISFDASPLANRFYPTSRLEQSAIAQHGMHDDCEAAGKGDASLLQAATLGDLHGPCFQGEGLTAPGEDRVGSFVQQLAYGAVTLFGDPACPVELARLMASGYKAEVGPGIA